jgi:hypothetical protein
VDARRFNTATGDTTGPAVRVGDPMALRSPVFLYAEYNVSASGTIVTVSRSPFTVSDQGTLHFVGADGKDAMHTLPFRARRVARPRYSPDGKLVAAVEADVATRLITAFVYDPDRRATTPLPHAASIASADWVGSDSIMSIGMNGDVFIQSIHGEVPRRLGTLGGWGNAGQLSVRGDWLVFDGDREGSLHAGVAHRDSIDHSRMLIGALGGDSRPRLSMDGRFIAFLTSRGGPSSLHVASFPSLADEIVISNGVTVDSKWANDGSLYYIGSDRRLVAVQARRHRRKSPGCIQNSVGEHVERGRCGLGHRRRRQADRVRLRCCEQRWAATPGGDGQRVRKALIS